MSEQGPGQNGDLYALPSSQEDEGQDTTANVRSDTRLPFDVKVEIRAPNCSVSGTTRDVSLSGLFVECDEEIPLDAECVVSLQSKASDPEIEHKARVVRLVNEAGMRGIGLEFTGMEED